MPEKTKVHEAARLRSMGKYNKTAKTPDTCSGCGLPLLMIPLLCVQLGDLGIESTNLSSQRRAVLLRRRFGRLACFALFDSPERSVCAIFRNGRSLMLSLQLLHHSIANRWSETLDSSRMYHEQEQRYQ